MPDIAFLPAQASTTAREVDTLGYFLVGVCGAVGLLVAVLVIYFSIRYRRRPGQIGPPEETHDWHALEWFWTLAPVGVFFVMFVWGAVVYSNAYRAPDDAMPVYVVGKQWMWKFQHPEGQREINTLHVALGRPVKLILTSEDVIHSFFVPAFRIHMDVLPDRYTSVWFQATRKGTYHLFCSQYCGTSHSDMIGTVSVLEPAEYQRWLESNAEGSLALQGRTLFLKHRCVSCHSGDETARAPMLESLYGKPVPLTDGRTVIADEDYLRESILHPAAKVVAGYEPIMPTFVGRVSEEEIISLVAYIQSLAPGEMPKRVEDYPPPVRTAVEDEETGKKSLQGEKGEKNERDAEDATDARQEGR